MRVPIMPVIVEGTRHALPKHSMDYHGKHPIRVRVLEEIPASRVAGLSEEELCRQVWEYMNAELARLRTEMGTA
jgi:1-acyl-sn-glycerol-3-phosphate acyltransferase